MATKKKTTKDKYNQVDYFASQTASMVYGGLSKDMTPAQKKKQKEAEKALEKIRQERLKKEKQSKAKKK